MEAGDRPPALVRLVKLLLTLQASRALNARELAEICRVSRRTIFRDLKTLEQAGVPVRFDADREGYQLAAGFGITPPALNDREATALLVLTHAVGGDGGAGLLQIARDGVSKLISSLPAETRSRVSAIAELIEVHDPDLEMPPERLEIQETLLTAFVKRVQIRVRYWEPGSRAEHSTKLSPYRLVIVAGAPMLIGRSSAHRQVRAFRLPWIRHVELTEDRYAIPPRFDGRKFLEPSRDPGGEHGRTEVWVRFSPLVAPEVEAGSWHSTQRIEPRPDGSLDLRFEQEGTDDLPRWVLAFGDHAEVIAPAALRQRRQEIAERVARVHEHPAPPDREDLRRAAPLGD